MQVFYLTRGGNHLSQPADIFVPLYLHDIVALYNFYSIIKRLTLL